MAVLVTVSVANSSTVRLACTGNTGALFGTEFVLLIIVSVAVWLVPRITPPIGFPKARFTVSFGSTNASAMIGTVKTLLVSPGPNSNAPACAT